MHAGPPPSVPDDDAAALRTVAERWHARGAAAPAPRYAGALVRLVAMAIDIAVLGAFVLPLALAGFAGVKVGLLMLGATPPAGTEDALVSLLVVGWLVMAVTYFTALHRGAGQTIGKALLGIGVRRARDLAAIGTARSLGRALAYGASSSFFGLGFLMVALTPHKRGWHDYLAGTCVVRLAPDEA